MANEKFREQDLEPAPAVEQYVLLAGRRVVELEAHVRMLLVDNRNKARMYLNDIFDVGLLDQTWPSRFQPELASRLQYLLDHPEPWHHG